MMMHASFVAFAAAITFFVFAVAEQTSKITARVSALENVSTRVKSPPLPRATFDERFFFVGA